ncbi:MAG: hypothetical protein ACK5XP_05680, partial [Sphingobacteriia bacterium]
MQYRLSRWLSILLNPNTLQLLGALYWQPRASGAFVLCAVALLLLVPLVAYLLYTRYYLRRADALQVSRQERILPFGVNLLCLLFFQALSGPLQATPELRQYVYYLLVINVLGLGVTLCYKVSLHLAAAAGLLGYTLWWHQLAGLPASWPVLIGLPVLVPLLAWARYRQQAHTVAELAAGVLLGLFSA